MMSALDWYGTQILNALESPAYGLLQLLIEVTCPYDDYDLAAEVAPVQIIILGNIIKLCYEGTGRQAGLFVSEALSRLARECTVTLVATLNAPKRSKPKSFSMSFADSLQTGLLKVTVYGLFSEKTAVTNILDSGNLFLQRPDDTGYDKRVRYFNPMYLLRPGAEMPRVVGHAAAEGSEQTAGSVNEISQELERNLALKIFDEANGLNNNAFLDLKQSPRLVSKLKEHIRPTDIRSFLYHGPDRQDLANGIQEFDVVLTTYDTIRSDWKVHGPLYRFTWARVILDEAHKIRNPSSDIFNAACQIQADYRWCLTGTPIQNSLDDFGSLLAFIGVPPFFTRDQFRFWVSSPVQSNITHSFKTLRKLVRATCLRRTKAAPNLSAALELTRKTERAQVVELSPEEREIYEFFKRRSFLLIPKDSDIKSKTGSKANIRVRKRNGVGTRKTGLQAAPRKNTGNIIVLISILRMICNHGEALLPKIALEAWRNRDTVPISWSILQSASSSKRKCCICDQEITFSEGQAEGDVIYLSCHEHVACEACIAWANKPVKRYVSDIIPQKPEGRGTLTIDLCSVIFSQWTGLSSVRIDGQSTLQHRRNALDKFNSDGDCVVMLATIGAVSEGIDLSVASETHLVEPHWNPMAEAQAVDRVHRIGQTKDVNITRYYAKESVEEYVRWVQARKLRLISQSLHSELASDMKEKEELVEEERWQELLRYLK
ncbi:hypothetical protein NUW58_g706 [Xylaria curta]|uniref:Uncharacterized protein n=1 Tax=Xylaria curta TaxID=42375 RepID=A0ACC1PND0_9PEZI|nr:hypothetical protein NUW58_g706 [Xylaria curta]